MRLTPPGFRSLSFDADGSYLLELPYADPRERVMDILRHVPEVGVRWAAGLRDMVEKKLREGLRRLTP
jgi:predicted DNA-binding transcriptional regulator YafY